MTTTPTTLKRTNNATTIPIRLQSSPNSQTTRPVCLSGYASTQVTSTF